MRPLALDDLLPLEEYAGRRREFFEAHQHYLDRYRRVRIGPRPTLLFENRQTLWFRVQELLFIARLTELDRLQEVLDVYNHFLPCGNHLKAVLLIEITDESRLVEELAPWKTLQGEAMPFCLGSRRYPADLLTARPEDRTIGAAHWVEYALDDEGRKLLANPRQPAYFEVAHQSYQHQSAPLGEEVRLSLIEDLELSEKAES